MKRKGDSNGEKLNLKMFQYTFYILEIFKDKTCSILVLKDRNIILIYMSFSTDERGVKHFHYRFQKHDGKIVVSRKYH